MFAGAPDDAATFRELSMQVHRLSGSAGAYGYDRLGERACVADRLIGDQLIAPERHRGAALVRYFAASVQSLLDELETAHAHEAPPMQDARAAR